MKICIESKDLLTIAGEIERSCDQIDNTDGAYEDNEVSELTSEIRQLAYDLAALANLKEKQNETEASNPGLKEHVDR